MHQVKNPANIVRGVLVYFGVASWWISISWRAIFFIPRRDGDVVPASVPESKRQTRVAFRSGPIMDKLSVFRGIATVAAVLALIGSVKAVSTDGEATVYLRGNFTGAFDVRYRAAIASFPRNGSWSMVGLLLVGHIPGPSAYVGVTSPGNDGRNAPFAMATELGGKSSYVTTPDACATSCVIELRGDHKEIQALVNGRVAMTWARAIVPLVDAGVQLNAEVSQPGDRIEASLTPIHAVADGRVLGTPTCGFTTQGVAPTLHGQSVLFAGGYRPGAPADFVALKTGRRGDRC